MTPMRSAIARARAHVRRLYVLAPTLFVGCSFLGLSDYEVKQCDVAGGSGDPCPELCFGDARCSSCKTYRCNVPARRCDLVDVDVDGDGDRPVACGGTDCDDTNAKVSGRVIETCNGVDDNCDGNVDEDLIGPGQPSLISLGDTVSDPVIVRDRATGSTLASFMRLNGSKPPCVLIASDTDGPSAGDCALFSVDPGRARQPYSRPLGQSFPPIVATVYSRTDMCGGLSLRTTTGGAIDLGCSDPATLPAIIGLDDYAYNAIVTYYAAPIAESCADVKPAKLLLRQIVNARQATPFMMGLVELSPASASVRPPAFVTASAHPGTLIAAPDEATGVGFWFVTEPETAAPQVVASVAPVNLGTSLVGARAVDVAIARRDYVIEKDIPFAVVAEIGCPPMQRVAMTLGTLSIDGSGGLTSAQLGASIDIGTAGKYDASPSIAWEPEPYREWRVSFIVDDAVFVQRVSAEGKLVGHRIDASPDSPAVSFDFAAVAALGLRSNVFAVSSAAISDAAGTVVLGCSP